MAKLVLQNLKISVVQPKRKNNIEISKRVSELIKAKVIEDDEGYKAVIDMKNDPDCPDKLVIPFTEKSYDLKDRESVFSKIPDKNGKRIRYIRSKEKAKFHFGSSEFYTPFAPNWIISGHIIKNKLNNTILFDFCDLITIDGYDVNVSHPELDDIDKLVIKK